MTPAEQIFERVADEFARRPGVERNGRGSLVVVGGVGGAVRAMTSRGRVVVKLRPARVTDLVARGRGEHYKNQRNAWLELDLDTPEAEVRQLVGEALEV